MAVAQVVNLCAFLGYCRLGAAHASSNSRPLIGSGRSRLDSQHPLQFAELRRPDAIHFTDSLPKTRSGKIMRRILRSLAAGEEVSGDTSTLEDRSVLDALRV